MRRYELMLARAGVKMKSPRWRQCDWATRRLSCRGSDRCARGIGVRGRIDAV